MAGKITYLAAAFAAGVYLASKFDIFFVLLTFLLYAAIYAVRRRREPTYFIIAAAFALGIILTQYYSSPNMQAISAYDGKYVTLTGRICELPVSYGDANRYVLDTRRVTMDGRAMSVRERVLITSPEVYSLDDTVEFSGFIRGIDEKMNENGFDLKRYYKSKAVFYRCYAYESRPSGAVIASRSVYALSTRLKNSISQLLDRYTYNDKNAILKAVIIGSRHEFSEDYAAVLNRTGTARFFYPAFMHVMLLTAIAGLFSGIVKRKYREAALVAMLILYAMAESSHPVMVKSCLVAAFLIIFRSKLRFIYFPDIIGAVVLTIGISNPLIFFNAGFVQSCTASLLINIFYEPVSRRLNIRNRYVKKMITLGIICTIGLLPLSAYYFNGISIYTIITSLVFLPATFVILALSPLMLAMLAVFSAAPVIEQIVTLMLWIYMKLPYCIDALPFSHIALPKVSVLTIAAFYVCVYGLYLLIRRRRYNALLTMCVSAAFFAVVISGEIPRLNKAEFTFVNVGQGDGALVSLPYRDTVLIDGGGTNGYGGYDAGKYIYLPYLQAEGIGSADCAIVSHCHSDHAFGIIAAIKNMRVRHLYLPETSPDNEIYQELMRSARQYGTDVHIVTEPVMLNFKSGIKIAMYPPGENALLSDDENDKSLLVRVSYGETDCLFTGDMPKAEEYALVDAGIVTPAEILKVAHHGSDTSSSRIFLDAALPDYAVISVGENNSYGLPSEAVLERLNDSEILRTDENGDITITADKSGIAKIHTYK